MSARISNFHPLIVTLVLSQVITLENCWNIGGVKILSLANYSLMAVSVFYLLYFVRWNHQQIDFEQKILVVWIAVLYVLAIPDIFNPYNGFYNLKMFLTYNSFLYTIPLFMLVKLDMQFIRQLFKFVYVLAILYFPSLLVAPSNYHEGVTALAEGSLILLMTYPYHSSRKKTVIIIVILISITIMMLETRRNKVVYYGGGLVFALFINIIGDSGISSGKKLILVFSMACLLFGLLLSNTVFDSFYERVGTGFDSREDIVKRFVNDFNRTPIDWVFGRGLYGDFDAGVLSTNLETGTRGGIENGYFQLILNGGGLWLLLLIIISIKAVYQGYFKSNNLLCKGAAMIIVLYFFDMIGFGIPQTTMKYIMVFISIAICNTPWLRECDNSFLSKEIGLK